MQCRQNVVSYTKQLGLWREEVKALIALEISG